jgi:hypothetical protein
MLPRLPYLSVTTHLMMEVNVKYMKFVTILPALLLVAAVALAGPARELKSFKGTWLCPTCAEMKQADTPENCEAKGHKHALKLDDGLLITFVDNARATALIHGGGREKAKIEVVGLYDAKTQTLDVEAYEIDDAWSTWCDQHSRMDFCRATGAPGPSEPKSK